MLFLFYKSKEIRRLSFYLNSDTLFETVSNIEKGSTILISPVVGKIAEALGLSEEALFLGPMTDIHDVLEDEEVPYMTQNAYLTNRLRIAEDALSEYQAKNKSLERDISEKELSIEDLRSAVRILKRAKGFENPEKI